MPKKSIKSILKNKNIEIVDDAKSKKIVRKPHDEVIQFKMENTNDVIIKNIIDEKYEENGDANGNINEYVEPNENGDEDEENGSGDEIDDKEIGSDNEEANSDELEKSDESSESDDNEKVNANIDDDKDDKEIADYDEDRCVYNFADDKSDEDIELVFDDDDVPEISDIVSPDERKSKPFLFKYERVRLLGDRTQQLTLGAKPMIKNIENLTPKEIAELELQNNIIPLIIQRPLPNGKKERWFISELKQ